MFDVATLDINSIDSNLLQLIDKDTIIILNKQDLVNNKNTQLESYFKSKGHKHVLSISCASGNGTQELLASLEVQLKQMYNNVSFLN